MQGILTILLVFTQIATPPLEVAAEDGIPYVGMMPELVVTAPRYHSDVEVTESEGVQNAKIAETPNTYIDRNPVSGEKHPLGALEFPHFEIQFLPSLAYAEDIELEDDIEDVFFGEGGVSGDYYLPESDTVWDDITVKGGTARIDGVVFGDLTVMGGRAVVRGTVDGDVAVFGGNLDLMGKVTGDCAVFGGNFNNRGQIEGDVAVIGGTVLLDSASIVEGDISTLGGSLERDDDAIVEGEVMTIGIEGLSKIVPRISRVLKWQERMPFGGALRSVFVILAVIVLYIINLLLFLIVPGATERITEKIRSNVWISVGIGVGLEILYVPIIVLLAVSIIGIPIIPLFALAVIVGLLFGFTAMSYIVGQRILGGMKSQIENRVGVFSIGWIAIMIIPIMGLLLKGLGVGGGFIFVIGLAILYVTMTIGLGGVIFALFKRRKMIE